MAKQSSVSTKPHCGLRPILLFTFAAMLLFKAQRGSCEKDESSSVSSSEGGSAGPVCPNYCNLPSDRATRGKAPFRMWYYDASEGSCRRFRWGGRGGNKNRFRKKADCEETCSKCNGSDVTDDGNLPPTTLSPGTSQNLCYQPMNEGRCVPEGSKKYDGQPQLAWYFDKAKAQCTPFIYFGCGGNNNRFERRENCEEVCH